MPDDLYECDVLAWSWHQAALLRRVARGERVNDVDWDHVVEGIEDVGLSELNAVRAYLRLVLVHRLKLRERPEGTAWSHWRMEVASFQAEADQRFHPPCVSASTLPICIAGHCGSSYRPRSTDALPELSGRVSVLD